ncbi:MAG: GNAT family N-acetyltransferase [Vulcanimicrobiaceae bacterium]
MTARGRVLEAAVPADIAGIVAIETHPSMTPYIGSWTAERHLRHVADPDFHYYVVRDARGDVDGFAIVWAFAPKFRWYELSRIAVANPGEGRGSDLLHAVLDATFERADAHRIQLECYEDNLRARRAYARAGFREEGLMRNAVTRDGAWVSLVLMALLEDDRVRPASPAGGVPETRG